MYWERICDKYLVDIKSKSINANFNLIDIKNIKKSILKNILVSFSFDY